jgi:hypothetical protein
MTTVEGAVLFVLADFANHETASCWPGQTTVSTRARCSERATRAAMKVLEHTGLITRTRRSHSNGYRKSDHFTINLDLKPIDLPAPGAGRNIPSQPAPRAGDNRHHVPVTTGTTCRAIEPLDEPLDMNHQITRDARAEIDADVVDPEIIDGEIVDVEIVDDEHEPVSEFDRFWSAYPRKVGKKAALKAWEKAIRDADPETIIAAAQRYAANPNLEPKYTAHPTTWLNQGRWDDVAEDVAPVAAPQLARGGMDFEFLHELDRRIAAGEQIDFASGGIVGGPQITMDRPANFGQDEFAAGFRQQRQQLGWQS